MRVQSLRVLTRVPTEFFDLLAQSDDLMNAFLEQAFDAVKLGLTFDCSSVGACAVLIRTRGEVVRLVGFCENGLDFSDGVFRVFAHVSRVAQLTVMGPGDRRQPPRTHHRTGEHDRFMNDFLTTKGLSALWNISERPVREQIGRLEALGFRLERGLFGERRVPVELAHAVLAIRESGAPLESLLAEPDLARFRGSDSIDPLAALIEARAENQLTRGVLLTVVRALEQDGRTVGPSGGWAFKGLIDPRGTW